MKTACCIESGKISPKTSSCSMILRSACSHGHSHKSVAINEVQAQEDTHKIRKWKGTPSDKLSFEDSSKSTIKFDSFWSSSLKELALTTTKSFSVFKENLHNHLEVTENQKSELLEKNGQDSHVIKQLRFSKTSTPLHSPYINDIKNHKDFNKEIGVFTKDSDLVTLSNMSRTRSLQRHNLRALSGSESEEDPSFLANREKLKKTKKSGAVSKANSSAQFTVVNSMRNVSSNHQIHTQKVSSTSTVKSGSAASLTNYPSTTPTGHFIYNQSINSPDSPQVDRSVVQYSTFDRLRWFLWRYIYLKIIATVNFDVWLLSRLHDRKKKAIGILLLPLLLYLLYSARTHNMDSLSKLFDLIYSTLITLLSSIYSLISSPFIESLNLNDSSDSSHSCPLAILPSLGAVFSSFTNFFVKTEERSHFISETRSKSSEPMKDQSTVASVPIISGSFDAKANREEIRSVAVQVIEEKFNDLVNNFYDSRIHSDNLKIKDETSKLQKEIFDLRHQFQSLSGLLKQLETGFHSMEKSAAAKDFESSAAHSAQFKLLNEKMKAFELKLESLAGVKKCCDEKMSTAEFTASIEKYIVAAFRSVVESKDNSNSPYNFFSKWLNDRITDSSKLSLEVNSAFEKLKSQLKADTRQDTESLKVIEGIVQHYVESLKRNLTVMASGVGSYDSLSVSDMRKIAKEAIMLYDADKTGLVDYALESAGGSVLGTRCSESYVEKNGKFSVFGLPLWSDQNSPRTAIQPSVQPGECWAFKGSQGFLVIQLSYTIYPTGFTLEHIPVSLSPTGSIDSAPKNFSVWGLASESDNEGTILGSYVYDQNGEPLQYFPVQNLTTKPFSFVELKILSNHGNQEYTCLYRFRVHGTRVK